MGKIALYYHGGSKNHGCEAIIRSTVKLLERDVTLYSANPEEDLIYGIEKIVELKSDIQKKLNFWNKIKAAVSFKIFKNDYVYTILAHKAFFKDIQPGDIYLSVGGDNYCYLGREVLGYYNKAIHKKGGKTILWGCSFEQNDLTDKIRKDIAMYDLIIARESISYEILKKINKNTYLLPDPAFQLDCTSTDYPEGFIQNNTIGINLSPLICRRGEKELILKNYINLIQWILDNTKLQIALIPHVVTVGSDDRTVLELLYNRFSGNQRVILVSDHNCMELKEIISKCKLFVGARTHATIAAYSMGVPTLVVGYSVKATGIARELFGTDENYVLPVQKLCNENDLSEAFEWLYNNEEDIRKHLNNIMFEYKKRVLNVRELIEKL